MEQLSTESIYRARLSDVVLLMYGKPLDLPTGSSSGGIRLSPNRDCEHISYAPPRLLRAGSATVACVVEIDDSETDHATICARVPGRASRWLRSRFSSGPDGGEDPAVWLHVESWPAEYSEGLKLPAVEYEPGEIA